MQMICLYGWTNKNVSSDVWRMIMVAPSLTLSRRQMLAGSAALGAFAYASKVRASSNDEAVFRFYVDIPDDAIVDLGQRLAATRWPYRETVTDQSQGVPLAKLQDLVRYWMKEYNWRNIETQL